MHAALGEVDAVDAVHVGDHRVQRERGVGGEPGVHGLEAEQPVQPRIAEALADRVAQPAERVQPEQPGDRERGGGQPERGVVVAVDEVRHLDLVELLQPVHEVVERGRVQAAAGPVDLLPHGLATVPDEDRAAVGEAGPVRGVEPGHRQQTQVGVDRPQRVGDQVRHGQHGRPGVEGEAVAGQHPGPTARHLLALDHGDPMAATGQVARRRQAGQAGADHDDRVHRSRQAIRLAIWVSPMTPSGSSAS